MEKVNEAHAQALARIETAKMRIAAFGFALKGVRARQSFAKDSSVDTEFHALHRQLYKDLNDAFRDALMWGAFNPDSEMAQEGKRLALQHYAREGVEIMSWLDVDRVPPARYLAKDHDSFRGDLDELMRANGLTPDGRRLPHLSGELHVVVAQLLRQCEQELKVRSRKPQYLVRVRELLMEAKGLLFRRFKNPPDEG